MTKRTAAKRQRGALMIEAMIGILIFTVACLGIVGLQANLMKETQQSRFRIEAGYLVNGLVSTMWGDAMANHGSYDYTGDCQGAPAALAQWCAAATNLLPAMSVDIVVAVGTPPLIPTSANITLNWQMPNDTSPRRYQTVALIGP
jgi:Tfp pilus assembly protein PilV